METNTKRIIGLLILPLLLGLVLVIIANQSFKPDFLLHVNFYDVGQGDSIFIQTHLGNQILIDGGPNDKVLTELGNDMPFFDRTIDMLILTHPHTDHVAGLVDIIRRFKVKKVIMPEVKSDVDAYDKFLEIIEEKNVETVYKFEGQRIYLDTATVFDVYYPPQGRLSEKDLNNTSIVGKLSFGQTSFLFVGDAGIAIENSILPKYDLDVDVLKVGHHGSRFSTSLSLLSEVTPEYSVISVGENNYGHPTEEVLDKLHSGGSQVFRTDQDHTIKFISDGMSLERVK
ncbi:MAG: MBL fold metallo-hydrolase [bacterium]|nr:MBL fold metallo-hydrolase [bacterium]